MSSRRCGGAPPALVVRHPAHNYVLNRLGTDLVLVVHFAFVAFAVFGGFLIGVNEAWIWIHLPVVLWSSVINLASGTCPLTPMENLLRRRAGSGGYAGGFVQHYIGSLVYPKGMPRRLELVAGVSIVVWNSLVYAYVFSDLLSGR